MRGTRVVVAVGLFGAGVGVLGVVRAATRLDRLHVRTDAAWVALDAALERRAFVVSALEARGAAPDGVPGSVAPGGAGLGAVADAARRAGRLVREDAENELGRALATLDRAALDPAGAAQLTDAEQRVVIARRVYNDAVRDTLALRSRRLVRWLRLAGTAPLPRYFEIAEPVQPGEPPPMPAAAPMPAAPTRGQDGAGA